MAKGKTPKHTACRRGTKVILKFRDGTKDTDIFLDRKGGHIYFKKHGKISKKSLESFKIWKDRHSPIQ